MGWKGLRYSGKNMAEAKEKARRDNEELKAMSADAEILVNTIRWDRDMGRRGQKGVRYYKVDHIGNLFA